MSAVSCWSIWLPSSADLASSTSRTAWANSWSTLLLAYWP
jgi:hypothetical protein